MVLIKWVAYKGSGEPAHKCSLAKAFVVRRQVLNILRKFQTKQKKNNKKKKKKKKQQKNNNKKKKKKKKNACI